MQHLDEGTIHAWLDGGLNAAQSEEVDAHVKTCAECSAKVAEARGLIAASSRILTALDDTPANVVPKPAVAPLRKRRSIAPWVSGLAAAAVLITLWRTGDVEQPAPLPEIRLPDIPAVSIPEPALSDVVKAPAPVSATVASAERQAKLPPPSAPQPAAPALRPLEGPQASVGRVTDATGAGSGDQVRLRRARDFAAGSAANSAVAITTRSDSSAAARREAADEARSALRPPPASPVARAEVAQDDFSLRLSGCYRAPTDKMLADAVTTTSVGAAAAAAKKSTRAASGAAAPSAPMAQSVAAPVIMQLDTLATGDGFALRDASSRRVLGVWSPMNADSARVTVPGAGTYTFVIYDKVKCPE